MKKYSFNSIALIIWILTVYCKVSNGKPVSEHLNVLYKEIGKLKRLDEERSNEIQLLKSEKDKDIQSLKSEKDKEINLLQLEIKKLKLRTAPKSCAQLSFTGLMNDGKKEWIDPDGRSTGNNPIEVSILRHFLKNTVSLQESRPVEPGKRGLAGFGQIN